MAAPINFSVNLTDTGGGGVGPYTIQILQAPGTVASGGTDVSANAGSVYFNGAQTNITTNPTGVVNPQELMGYAAHVIGDVISANLQNDALN